MHVAIIGAGVAGISAANELSKRAIADLQITLIDPKSYVEVYWATIRALFDADIAKGASLPLAEWAAKRNVTHKRASAKALSTESVVLDSGEEVKFDVCLIATGATTNIPSIGRRSPDLEFEERRKSMMEYGESLLSKRHILIAGGGAIGTEFAGDIAYYASEKGKEVKITLVHSGDHLVPEFQPSAAAKLKAKLEALGIRIVLKDKAVQKDDKWILQSSGEVLDVDEVIMSVGIKPCTAFFTGGGVGHMLDERGFIKVDEYFQVEAGNGRLFAVGDCCNALAKTGINAMHNSKTVANNVLVAVTAHNEDVSVDERMNQMQKKVPGPAVTLVTVGRKDGIAQTPFGAITFFLPWFKNYTMFLFEARRAMGY